MESITGSAFQGYHHGVVNIIIPVVNIIILCSRYSIFVGYLFCAISKACIHETFSASLKIIFLDTPLISNIT